MPAGPIDSRMSDKIKKRQDEAKFATPSTKDFDEYAPLHAQAKNDLDRSMVSIAEGLEAESHRLELCQDQHMFGDESVERERTRGEENIAKIRGIVDMQDQVYRTIMAKVHETEDPELRRKDQAQARTDSRSDRRAEPFPVEESDSFRVQHACTVANQLVKNRFKKDLHQRKRAVMALEESKYYDSLREKHRLVDERAARSQQVRVEKQMEKTFYAQQRRNEQQKMLKEIQRSQDHQFELLQLKHHPTAVSTSKLPALAPASSSPSVPDGEPIKLNRHMSEPIYRDITNSHKLYSTTLER